MSFQRRAFLFATALFLSFGLWLAAASPAQGQEVEPKTTAIRFDATRLREHVRVALQCGPTITPLGLAYPGVVTDLTTIRTVDLCADGHVLFAGETFNGIGPVRPLTTIDRGEDGPLGGILFCANRMSIDFVPYRTNVMHFSCEEARAAIRESQGSQTSR